MNGTTCGVETIRNLWNLASWPIYALNDLWYHSAHSLEPGNNIIKDVREFCNIVLTDQGRLDSRTIDDRGVEILPSKPYILSRRLVALAAGLVCGLGLPTTSRAGAPAVWTQHNDNGRTGNNLSETTLTPANVTQAQFGKLFSYTLDDQTYSQPLYVPGLTMSVDGKAHNVVFV